MDPTTPLQPYVPPANPVNNDGLAPAMPPSMPPLSSTAALPETPGLNPIPASGSPLPSAMGAKDEIIEKLRQANNVMVTVSSNPSVDQLAAAIGVTLLLNKLDKHATAVFSGEVPSTLEFLQPEKTIEKNTDSLRDFIIALDKAKADKLRYKVEDKFVKIFITPFHTSLSENDLEFSQGDFNVDVVLAIGVHKREELDQAITTHGRILHDALVASVNNAKTADLGTVNWYDATASSLCEMLVGVIEPLQGEKALLDTQIATAFLTGVVAETQRFSNDKTTPHTMNVSAMLMKAGANQQLVASKLEAPQPMPKAGDKPAAKDPAKASSSSQPVPTPTASADGSLAIEHKKDEKPLAPSLSLKELEQENAEKADPSAPQETSDDLAKIHIDETGELRLGEDAPAEEPVIPKPLTPLMAPSESTTSHMILEPPTLGGALSSNTPQAQPLSDPALDPLQGMSLPTPGSSSTDRLKTIQPLGAAPTAPQTLDQIEASVSSPHAQPVAAVPAPVVPDPVLAPVPAVPAAPALSVPPIAALDAQPVDLEQHDAPAPVQDNTTESFFPPQLVGPDNGLPPDPNAGATDPSAPPPVPPPMMPLT